VVLPAPLGAEKIKRRFLSGDFEEEEETITARKKKSDNKNNDRKKGLIADEKLSKPLLRQDFKKKQCAYKNLFLYIRYFCIVKYFGNLLILDRLEKRKFSTKCQEAAARFGRAFEFFHFAFLVSISSSRFVPNFLPNFFT
jgi:hypothetical protein